MSLKTFEVVENVNVNLSDRDISEGVDGTLVRVEDDDPSFPLKTVARVVSVAFDGADVDVTLLITRYAERIQIVLTETGKPGSVFCVSRDRPKTAASSAKASEFIYTIDLVLGVESDEALIFCRLLAQALDSPLPLLVTLGFRKTQALTPPVLKSLVQHVQSLI